MLKIFFAIHDLASYMKYGVWYIYAIKYGALVTKWKKISYVQLLFIVEHTVSSKHPVLDW